MYLKNKENDIKNAENGRFMHMICINSLTVKSYSDIIFINGVFYEGKK